MDLNVNATTMKILMNTGGFARTNCFVVADEVEKQAVIFDAPDHTTAPLLEQVRRRGWELVGLWLTHGHFDHLADHQVVTDAFPKARVLIHRLDAAKLRQPSALHFQLPFVIPSREPDALVEDGGRLSIGSMSVEVLHTPGHAPGHVMYHLPAQQVLIGGDLIIGGAVGRTDLPDSNQADLVHSIQRVMRLPGETRLMPGHGGPSRLADELRDNPYVRAAMGLGQ